MQEYADQALNLAQLYGADYADVRIVEKKYEGIVLKNQKVEGVINYSSYGMGIRVIKDGFFGFAANPDMTKEKIETSVKRAIDIAKASSIVAGNQIRLSKENVEVGEWHSKYEIDPFKISLEDKISLLMDCENNMRNVKGVKTTKSSMNFLTEKKFFANSEGSRIYQTVLQSGAGISAVATDGKEVQVRSYPTSFGGQHMNRGYELVKEMKLAENAEKCAEEAVALLTAPQCPSERMDIILGEGQLALQVHESCGHATEIDRIFGMEVNFAGMTFLTEDKLRNFRYGSDLVNITADSTVEEALGGYGYDDDGVKAKRTEIIKNGMFENYISSRDTASRIGETSSGHARAEDWNSIPLVRMSNINLEPGDTPLEDIIKSTERGLLLTENRSWSIDDLRLNFQFGMEIGYMIENGEITGIVKNPTYTGITPEFWQSCDAIADKNSFKYMGVPNCGKGQPTQTMRVAHGVSYARFRNVKVGVGYDK